ncbi:DUF2264 domain-containing protein [Paenibacillus hexagrammi]|uniref:DUF2264 domain-containing protein n=1 Tax=Paenibacillus hexagrammi TaxID=2908839 RepID=A0ABY3SE36_9BACL|nr:DUF2264 domain-containing protein [Paenibacillus sp. YPD9-1]UJF31375.1 DUF2264 domain-containing protein [Paenibacillus sp. YPD9-1]
MAKGWELPITQNPLQTKKDWQRAFQELTDPLKRYYSSDSTRLYVGHTGTSYADEVAGLEGFSRILWGLAPLLAGGGESDLWDTYIEGIRNGTNPEHENYWGQVNHYDQRLVEMAAFGLMVALTPDKLKEKLNEQEMERLVSWLSQINDHHLYDCNWLLFRVMVQLGFQQAGMPYRRDLMDEILVQVERFYLEEGWYSDGVGGHSDYYVPFAIHFYCLVYAKFMEQEDPDRSALYKERAVQFASQFIHWFADEGSALPYGRSLAYRFSQCAFWSAMVFAGVEAFPIGVMKGMINRHLRWWFSQPIFQADGVLTIGYAYPNLVMAENYNAPGSPYWAMKSFLLLALPDAHPYWSAEELPIPELPAKSVQKAAHLVICRSPMAQDKAPAQNAHVFAFNSGHLSTNEHTHTSAKYEKFVYSTAFGFSVPRAEWGIVQGAFDSMLALSEGDNLYRVKRKCEETHIDDYGTIFARWKPWSDVEVQTWLLPGAPWHIRVHRIDSVRSLDGADGGYALGIDSGRQSTGPLELVRADDSLLAYNELGASGVKLLAGSGAAELVQPQANTNILHPRTVIPTVRMSFQPGVTWLVTAVFGSPNGSGCESTSADWQAAPYAEMQDGELFIYEQKGGALLWSRPVK